MSSEVKDNIKFWDDYYKDKHISREDIIYDDWLDNFKIVVNNSERPIIDLGSGIGNNIKYLTEKGKQVIACDSSINAINNIKENFPNIYDAKCFDMTKEFPFITSIADLVTADLCLQYFTKKDTIKILKDIRNVLINKGHLLVRVNSINDINYGAGKGIEVEKHLYKTEDGRYKRFFSYEDLFDIFNIYDIKYINEYTMTRYGDPKKTYILDLKNKK